jgi:hypothetical protein
MHCCALADLYVIGASGLSDVDSGCAAHIGMGGVKIKKEPRQ